MVAYRHARWQPAWKDRKSAWSGGVTAGGDGGDLAGSAVPAARLGTEFVLIRATLRRYTGRTAAFGFE